MPALPFPLDFLWLQREEPVSVRLLGLIPKGLKADSPIGIEYFSSGGPKSAQWAWRPCQAGGDLGQRAEAHNWMGRDSNAHADCVSPESQRLALVRLSAADRDFRGSSVTADDSILNTSFTQ